MNDFLRIYVLWAPSSAAGEAAAELISSHFDGIGMERDGVAYRIPVRFRSEPWLTSGPALPREIELDQAVHNTIVLLHDEHMHEDRQEWGAYISNLKAAMAVRGSADIYIPFGSPSGDPPLPIDAEQHIQYARRDSWTTSLTTQEARDARLLLHLLYRLRDHLRSLGPNMQNEPLFVSHAKADGDLAARAIVDYVNDTRQDVPLTTFYDAMELAPGEDYLARFKAEIKSGTLLAIVSDIYDSRPWCVFELTEAKRAGRPIVLADIGEVRTSRTYPYGANLPKVRVSPDPHRTDWIESLLVETLSEGLRCDLVLAQATRRLTAAGVRDALALPRPPELFDIVERAKGATAIIYPDPPLGNTESDILTKAIAGFTPGTTVMTLSEVK